MGSGATSSSCLFREKSIIISTGVKVPWYDLEIVKELEYWLQRNNGGKPLQSSEGRKTSTK